VITLASKAAPDVDLTACDREPIHIPGAIQPHGALLVLDPADFTILQASANAGALLGVTELLGRTLPEALAELPSGFRDDLRSWANGEAVVFLKRSGWPGGRCSPPRTAAAGPCCWSSRKRRWGPAGG
jgi:light-regulated signal transduction histidine kinase (bacteriophytochrome)